MYKKGFWMTKIPSFLFYLNKDSIYLKIPFILKFVLFILISFFALINTNYYINFIIAFFILVLIFTTKIIKHKPLPLYTLLYSIIIFYFI
jgi:hypothetical protein